MPAARRASRLALPVVLLCGLLAPPPATAQPVAEPPPRRRAPVGPGDAVLGPEDALVTIVEFADFQCPFSARVRATLASLRQAYGREVRLVFKHNPLPFHQRATPAAEAALEARAQGRFWELHDRLFANQQALADADLERHARTAGLDVVRLRRALAAGTHRAAIAADQQLAEALGLRGTPSFLINGRPLAGAQPEEKFRAAIDRELRDARAVVARGVPRRLVYGELMKDARAVVAAPTPPPPAVPRAPAAEDRTIYRVPVGGSPVRGGPQAKLTLVEFTDFECPFCGRVQATLTDLRRRYGPDLRIVLKHNPLPFHRHAQLAAEASLAAHAQGKFWELHDRLFAHQAQLERHALVDHARAVGLDRIRFLADLDHHRHRPAIEEDVALAKQLGALGTPTFFINGRKLAGAQPVDAFVALCDEELRRADAALRRGVPPALLYDELVREGAAAAPVAAPEPPTPPARPPTPAVEEMRLRVPVGPKDPSLGPATARVVLVEFAEFQCPHSQRSAGTIHDLVNLYPKDLRVVFKQLPLPTLHAHSSLAAEAALAAHAQGRFWAMHDALFGNQPALDRAALERYADQIGLDLRKFRAALNGHTFKAAVDADAKLAATLGIDGTPTLVINGRKLVGAQSLDEIRAVIDQELKRAKRSR